MRGRPFQVTWHPEDQPHVLKAAYKGQRDIELRTRLHGLWLLRSGRTLADTAATVGVHYRTVQRWVDWYRQGGTELVLNHKMGGYGQQPYLNEHEQQQVAEQVATGRFRTAGEIGEWIAEQYGVRYRPAGVYSLLGRLGCSPKVPRPVHVKADQEEQTSWKKGGSKQLSAKQK